MAQGRREGGSYSDIIFCTSMARQTDSNFGRTQVSETTGLLRALCIAINQGLSVARLRVDYPQLLFAGGNLFFAPYSMHTPL